MHYMNFEQKISSKNNYILLVAKSNTDFQTIVGTTFSLCCTVDSSCLANLYLVCSFTEESGVFLTTLQPDTHFPYCSVSMDILFIIQFEIHF